MNGPIANPHAERDETDAFLAFARAPGRAHASLDGFFADGAPRVVARAPGRLDVMGGIADYSGSLVLELPIAQAAYVAVAAHPSPDIWIASVDRARNRARHARLTLDELVGVARSAPLDPGQLLRAQPDQRWALYLAGTLLTLIRDHGLVPSHGYRILLASTVPEGSGVSSSAAIEVATMQALAALEGVPMDGVTLALACQRTENLIVGAPCGVMDQMTAACGERGRLLAILCQPATILGHKTVPPGIRFFGIDSGVRHQVGGQAYGGVRTAAFMGYRMIAAALGFPAQVASPGQVRIVDESWDGYLANVPPPLFAEHFEALLPAHMSGRDFLAAYEGITDAVTRVDPDRAYPVRAATRHAIVESARVQTFSQLLDQDAATPPFEHLGELMYDSHASYSACGLGAEATDEIVELVRAEGPASGLHGAKITGGGSGGTVAILGDAGSAPRVRAIAARYADSSGRAPFVFDGSSSGAAAFGTHTITTEETT